MKKYSLLLIPGCLMALLQCGKDNPVATAASNSHPAISGVFYDTGNRVARNAVVTIRPKSTLADTAINNLAKKQAQSRSTTTDGSGRFSFDSDMDSGIYVIEAQSGSHAALIDSVKIFKKGSNVAFLADTLKPMGAIKGTVHLSNGGDPQGYVLAFGIDRFVMVNAEGRFLFGGLAQGVYKLRLITGSNDYEALDTEGIRVFSVETTDIHVLSPSYRAQPGQLTLHAVYDTLAQMVTLHWKRLDSGQVAGYSLYRRLINGSGSVPLAIGSLAVADSVFVDSMGLQDQTYEYRIAIKNKSGQEGEKSDGVRVRIASYFTVDTVFIDSNYAWHVDPFWDFTVTPAGDLYIPSAFDHLIRVFDPMMNPKGQLGQDIKLSYKIYCEDDRIYTLQLSQGLGMDLVVLSAAGTVMDTLASLNCVADIDFKYGFWAVASGLDSLGQGDSIALYSLDGVLKKSWSSDKGFLCEKVLIADSNKLLCMHTCRASMLAKMVTYDFLGNKISEQSIPYGPDQNSSITSMAYDAQRQRLYALYNDRNLYTDNGLSTCELLLGGKIRVFNADYSIVANYNVYTCDRVVQIQLSKDGNLFVGVENLSDFNSIIKLKPLQR
jgi:hypothetical protein